MDAALANGGLVCREFAKTWNVNYRTVNRDLDAFVELGQVLDRRFRYPGLAEYIYAPGTKSLFTSNYVTSEVTPPDTQPGAPIAAIIPLPAVSFLDPEEGEGGQVTG